MKKLIPNALRFIPASLCLWCALPADNAQAAVVNYFWDINGATAGAGGATPTGSWESSFWSTDSTGASATVPWVEGNFPEFAAGSDATGSYTVTAGANHTIAGALQRTSTGAVTISGPGILTIDGTGGVNPDGSAGGVQQGFFSSGNLTFNAQLSGAGGIQSQSGQISLNNSANDYSGGTTLNAGLINFNGPCFGPGAITIHTSGSALIAEATGITVPNPVNVIVAGNVNLSATGNPFATTYSGNITLNANTLAFGVGGNTANTVTLSGVISGTGGIGRQSSTSHGTLIITGANTYSGKTSLQSSVTKVSSLNSVSSPTQQATSSLGKPSSVTTGTLSIGATTFTGTLLYVGPGETTDRVIDLAGTTGGATIQNDGTGALVFTSANTASGAGNKTLTLQGANTGNNTIGGAIVNGSSGSTSLTKAGAGKWVLAGANTYSGATAINGGTLVISADNNLGTSGGLTIGSATLRTTASLATSRSVTLNNASTFTVDPATTLTLNSGFTSTAANAVNLTLNGGGTLSLKGNTTIKNDSPLTVNNATLEIDPGSSGVVNATNKLVLANGSGSTVAMNVKSGTVNFGGPDFFVLADGSSTANATVNVTGGALNLYLGSGQRVMIGNQGVGNFNVSAGTVNFGSALGNIQLGGDTQYSGNNASGTLTLSGGAVNIAGSNPLLLGQNSSGKSGATGRLNLYGGTLTTSRAVTGSSGNSYVVFNGGTLKAGAASTAFVGSLTAATVSANGAIIDDGGFAITIPQALLYDTGLNGSPDGGLTKKGSSTLTLSAANTYTGGTYITGGALSVSADNNLGDPSGNIILGGGSLRSTATFSTARTLTFTNNGTLQVDPSAVLTLNNGFNNSSANGAANMTVNGGGMLNLQSSVSIANDNAFTANNITVNVDPGASGTFNTGGKFVVGNASGGVATLNFLSGTANFTGPEFFAVADGGPTINGVVNIQGGSVNVNLGGGLRVLIGNQGSGAVNISSGALVVGAGTGNIEVGGDVQWDNNNANGTLTLTGTGSMVVNGVGGIFELGRTNSHTGARGTLNLWGGSLATARSITGGNGASFFSWNGGALVALANNSSLLTNLSAAYVGANGAIIDAVNYNIAIPQSLLSDTNVAGTDGGLTKLGVGDLTLAGANTYTGPTLVNAGRLFVNGSLGTNGVSIPNGAALLGTGTINGPVAIQSGATLQPGSDTATGTLTVNANLALGGSTVMLLNRTSAQPSSRLVTSASLSFGGTLTVVNQGPALQTGDSFILFTAPAYASAFTAISLPPLDANLAWDTTQLAVNGTIRVATVASVTVSPASTNAECGGSIALTATITGSTPLSIQWFDTQTNVIAGATNATLTVTNITSAGAGTYTVQVTNNVGSASAIATVTVADTTAPVITLNGPNPMTVECHASFTEPGATALDACAGSLIVTNTGSVDPNSPGTYTLTYSVTDPAGNTGTATRTVNVVDTTPPVISWSFTNLTFSADNNCQALMPDVTGTNYILAADACSSVVTITQTPTNNAVLALGTNQVVLAVADSAGNVTYSTNTIVVADTTAPTVIAGTIAACYASSNAAQAAAIAATTVQDSCDSNPTVVASTVGTCSAVVTVTATDASGNHASVTYNTQVIAPPVFGKITATQGTANVKDCAATTVQGTVNISVPVSSSCALTGGLPTVSMVNGANSDTATFDSESPAGTFNYHWTVPSAVTTGTWTVTVLAADACQAVTSQFSLCLDNAQISGLVQLEGFVGTGTSPLHSRAVTFVATDATGAGANVLKTWTLTLTNDAGDTFAYTMSDAPKGTRALSAVTAWNLRSKVLVNLDSNGQAANVNFTAARMLRGGDFDGNNAATQDDSSILRSDFFSSNPVPDITGDGQVDFDDFAIFAANWLLIGDPQ